MGQIIQFPRARVEQQALVRSVGELWDAYSLIRQRERDNPALAHDPAHIAEWRGAYFRYCAAYEAAFGPRSA